MNEIILAILIGTVGEIGLIGTVREMRIMLHDDAGKVGYDPEKTVRQMKRYRSVFKKRRSGEWLIDTHHARAARSMTLDCARPAALRPGLRWERKMQGRDFSRAERCREFVNAAYQFVENPGKDECKRANQYGGAMDDPAAILPPGTCAKLVNCGRTVQRYYRYVKCEKTESVSAEWAAGGRMK